MSARLSRRLARLAAERRKALVTFVMAGDPDPATCLEYVRKLPAAGADIIELGMPFTDPMADGPAVQAAGLRALAAGMTLDRTLDLVARFRKEDDDTPIVLMGYYNPIHRRGGKAFAQSASKAGIDGLILVDLPPEEADELLPDLRAAEIDLIRLATPTTDAKRLPAVLNGSSGFVYYVSITGTTGAAVPEVAPVGAQVARIKAATRLPVMVGFGIRDAARAEAIARVADGAVVGTALVQAIERAGADKAAAVSGITALVRELAKGVARASA